MTLALGVLLAFVLLVVAVGFIREIRRGSIRQVDSWPLEARPVFTEREQVFYQRLAGAYPDYIVLAQVALSQLIRVKYGTPNWRSIFARYSQLVADFVVCREDFSVVAVIELDDASHTRPDRRDADQRKTKAVEAAGLRLVRIPAGPIPSQFQLQTALQLGDAVVRVPSDLMPGPPAPAFGQEPPEVLKPVFTAALVIVVAACAWWIYAHRGSSSPKAVMLVPAKRAAPRSNPAPKPPLPASTPADTAAQQVDEAKRLEAERALAAQQAAGEMEKRKQAAWAQYYQTPASCEHPPAWQDQVECGNKYIRAKREFEKLWAVQNGLPVPQ